MEMESAITGTIGGRIKRIRRWYKLNQSQMSAELGISRAHLANVEAENKRASEQLLGLISRLYGFNLPWLRDQVGAPLHLSPVPMTTAAVESSLRSERGYQERKWPGHKHTVGEWILIMDKCMTDAKRAYVTGHGDDSALHEIRQVTAVGIAAMEQCGAPLRLRASA